MTDPEDYLRFAFKVVDAPLERRPGRAKIIVAARRRRIVLTVATTASLALAVPAAVAIGWQIRGEPIDHNSVSPAGASSLARKSVANSSATSPSESATPHASVPTPFKSLGLVCPGLNSKPLNPDGPGAAAAVAGTTLREYLDRLARPDQALTSLDPARWRVLAATRESRVFGWSDGGEQVAVLPFLKTTSGWVLQSGTCNIEGLGEQSKSITQATLKGSVLQVTWENSTCFPSGRPLDLEFSRVQVVQLGSTLSVAVLTKPNPAAAIALAKSKFKICGGAGILQTTSISIAGHRQTREILDSGSVPPVLIPVKPRGQ